MRVQIVIDFMHIYYKYFYQNKSDRLKKLSHEGKDITLIYYCIRDIENIRRKYENLGHQVDIAVCIDSKSKKKEDNAEYKSKRSKPLGEDDISNIMEIQELLNTAGYGIYRIEGYEADDLIKWLVSKTKETYDYTVIYTNDKDIMINISDKVGCMRFKAKVGYSAVDKESYEWYLFEEFGVRIPYNAIGLYLSTVGDKADDIVGIKGFGNKAFESLIEHLESKKIDFSTCANMEDFEHVINECSDILNEEQMKQLRISSSLVFNDCANIECNIKNGGSSTQSRESSYSKYNMKSLIE